MLPASVESLLSSFVDRRCHLLVSKSSESGIEGTLTFDGKVLNLQVAELLEASESAVEPAMPPLATTPTCQSIPGAGVTMASRVAIQLAKRLYRQKAKENDNLKRELTRLVKERRFWLRVSLIRHAADQFLLPSSSANLTSSIK